MGRLFWKFFLAFWLALLTEGIGVGVAVWLHHHVNDYEGTNPIEVKFSGPFVNAAATVLTHSGTAGLRQFLSDWAKRDNPPLVAVDEQGREMLKRQLAPETFPLAKSLARHYPEQIQRVISNEGNAYWLFVLATSKPLKPLPPILLLDQPLPPPPGPTRFAPIAPILSGILASLLFSGLLAWYFSKPIRYLRSAFTAVGSGDLTTRTVGKMGNRRDELADLGKNFDGMVEQIECLMNAQQRLLHDVSHELRSPLARMQAAIGLAQQQPDKLPQTLARIERESQRMNDLIGELLTLSRLEAGVIGKKESVDIGELLSEVVEDARLEATAKYVSIDFYKTGTETAVVVGYNELLRRAYENILRNAIQHSDVGNIVLVTAKQEHEYFKVAIIDQGDGVAEADLLAIFLPFFRSSSAKKMDGIGLGLTIAQKAIAAHNGCVNAQNRPEGGLSVETILPLCAVKL